MQTRSDNSDLIHQFLDLGNADFLTTFNSIMMSNCEKNDLTSAQDSVVPFVEMTSKLIDILLDRNTKDLIQHRMSSNVRLLNFYSNQYKRDDLFIRYTKELAELHGKARNKVEEGFTILKYAKMLNWSEEGLEHNWKKYDHCATHQQLKQQLYTDIIDLFDEGKMWENALDICKELIQHHEFETYDYTETAKLYQRMSSFYKNIMNEDEPSRQPEYFKVAFIGKCFPASFLNNKTFVFRGKGFERLSEFESRVLDTFPKAELKRTLDDPTKREIEDDKQQRIQIVKYDPIPEENPEFKDKNLTPQIKKYYKFNKVSRFQHSRPFKKEGKKHKEKEAWHEFASLWTKRTVVTTRESFPNTLQWFPILDDPEVFEVSPLDNAIEKMDETNQTIEKLIHEYSRPNDLSINPLTMALKGIIDAVVMGGTANYEKAFFSDEYESECPEDSGKIQQLKDLIADQIPLLAQGMEIHDEKVPSDLRALHEQMENLFKEMRQTVEEKYGRSSKWKKNFNSSLRKKKGAPPPVPTIGNDLALPSGPYQTMTLGRKTSKQRSPKLSTPNLNVVAPTSPKRSSHTPPRSSFYH